MSRTSIITALLTVITAIACTHAEAVQRTHVSAAFGNDANTATNCTAAAPCRFFQAAMTVTDNNGEVIVLDSGGYGAVTITQSVALVAPTGVYAGISVFPGADGVTIATPGINVVLRGLSINGQGGNNGISMTAGNKLTVENCVISNLNNSGIKVSGTVVLRVTDTILRDNGVFGILLENGVKATLSRVAASGSVYGIYAFVNITATSTMVDITNTGINGNGAGVLALSGASAATIKLSVRDSHVLRNSNFGLAAESSAGSAVTLSASNNIVSNNGVGILAQLPGAKIIASGNTVTSNAGTGFFNNSGATFESAGNNTVRDNGGVSFGAITQVGNL